MSLRSKYCIVLLATVVVLTTTDWAVRQTILYPGYAELEYQVARGELKRCTKAVQQEVDELIAFARRGSSHRSTKNSLAQNDPKSIQKTFDQQTLAAANVNVIALYHRGDEQLWGDVRWPSDQAISPNPPAEIPRSIGAFVRSHTSSSSAGVGFQRSSLGVLLIASMPVASREPHQTATGTFVAGRLFDQATQRRIANRAPNGFQIIDESKAQQNESYGRMSQQLQASPQPAVVQTNDGPRVVGRLQGLTAASDLMISCELPAKILAAGKAASRRAALVRLVTFLAVATALFFWLQRAVLAPLQRLKASASLVNPGLKSPPHLPNQREDEVGQLRTTFSELLSSLTCTRANLVESISDSKSFATDNAFYFEIAHNLASALRVKCALIATCHDETDVRPKLRSLAVCYDGEASENRAFACHVPPWQDPLLGRAAYMNKHANFEFAVDETTSLIAESFAAIPVKDSAGKALAIVAIIHDQELGDRFETLATLDLFAARVGAELQRQAVDRALRESNRLLKGILEGSSDGIFLQDLSGRYQLANSAWAEFLGQEKSYLLGKTDASLLEPAECDPLRAHHRNVVSSQRPTLRELRLRRGTNNEQIIQVCKAPHFDGHQKVVGVIGVCRDITALRHAQEQASLHVEQLARAMRISTMGEMATGMAHEINQPLEAIANYSYIAEHVLAQNQPESLEELATILTQLREQSLRAGDIIRSMRRLSKKATPQRTPVDINNAVRDVYAMMQADLSKKQISVVFDFDEELESVTADTIQLQQILLNLLNNACDALVDQKIALPKIQVTTSLTGDGHVRIGVRDNGKGVSDDDLESIFEAFATTKADGMGIGLAISRSIAEAHQGRCWAHNDPQTGTWFYTTLPIVPGGLVKDTSNA